MASFGPLKNNLGRLTALGKSMGLKKHLKWPTLDEKVIQPNAFYLQVLGYAVTEYSQSFYAEVLLEEVPNIATIQDKKFVDKILGIARNHLSLDPKITTEQFLREGKWVQQKLEFLVNFCERLQQWEGAKSNKVANKPHRGG